MKEASHIKSAKLTSAFTPMVLVVRKDEIQRYGPPVVVVFRCVPLFNHPKALPEPIGLVRNAGVGCAIVLLPSCSSTPTLGNSGPLVVVGVPGLLAVLLTFAIDFPPGRSTFIGLGALCRS